MSTIFLRMERDCRSMVYQRSDAKDINLILGYMGDKPMLVVSREVDERADYFYERAVDMMADVVFEYEEACQKQGFEHRLVPSMILIDMAREFKVYDAHVPDHIVDDPEYA